VLNGQRSVLGAEADNERQSGVGEILTAVAGRGGNRLLLRTDSERIRCMGRRLHALHVEAERLVARSGCSAGVGNTTTHAAAAVWTGAGAV
jgi:hypothetical protein